MDNGLSIIIYIAMSFTFMHLFYFGVAMFYEALKFIILTYFKQIILTFILITMSDYTIFMAIPTILVLWFLINLISIGFHNVNPKNKNNKWEM